MEGGCAQRGTLRRTPSTAPASTTILSTAASRNCGDKARGKPRVGVWTLLHSQIPLPLDPGLPGPPHVGGGGVGKSRSCASVFPRPRLPKEPCQVQRQPCSFWPQPQLSRLSSMLGVETQLKTVRPHRASSDQAEPLPPMSLPHPCTHSGLGPVWSLGPVQDRETSGLRAGTSVCTPEGAVSAGGGATAGCPQLGAGPRVRVP